MSNTRIAYFMSYVRSPALGDICLGDRAREQVFRAPRLG
jgi:hypothetical protein